MCVRDEQNPVAATDQTLAQIRALLLKKYVLLAPLVR